MQPINLFQTFTAGTQVEGLVLVKDYVKKDMTNKQPLKGELLYQGKTMEFSVWANESFFDSFQNGDLKNRILYIRGGVTEYAGKQSINIQGIDFRETFTCYDVFYKAIPQDKVTALIEEFDKIISQLAEGYQAVVKAVLRDNPVVWETYIQTWAGAKMHDAQLGGLLNHTMKMVRLAQMMMYNDARLAEFKDLIYTSIFLHDIGKVHEIGLDGNYTKNSYVTHRTIGVEMVAEHKKLIEQSIGLDDYYQIIAVIQGHHGEYGDKPTTILTYIIHLIDMLEAATTGILDKITNNEMQEKNGTKRVWVGSDYPSLVVR